MKQKISWFFAALFSVQMAVWFIMSRQCHFYWDDYNLLFWTATRPLKELVSTGFLWGNQNYRPVLPIIHKLQIAAFGFNPWYFYLTNMAVIFIGLFFSWKAHRFLFKGLPAPVFLCFTLLPAFYLSFVHISNIILFFGFAFFSIALYLFFMYLKKGAIWMVWLSALFFFLALSSKEMFILMPFAFIIYDFLYSHSEQGKYRFTCKKRILYGLFFLPLCAYLVIRFFALKDVGGYEYYFQSHLLTYFRYIFQEPFILLNVAFFYPFSVVEAVLKLFVFSLVFFYKPSRKSWLIIAGLLLCLILASLPEWPIKALHYELPVTVLARNPLISFGEASSARFWFLPSFYLFLLLLHFLSIQPVKRRNVILALIGGLFFFNIHTNIRALNSFSRQSVAFRQYYRVVDTSLQDSFPPASHDTLLFYLENPHEFYRKPHEEALFHALAGLYMIESPFWNTIVFNKSDADYIIRVDKSYRVFSSQRIEE